ncbi:MAG: hypothetical protein BWY07_02390 [Candidatus Hydrogenedentes bacterium ADurb.Bin170]|nr:MAG: hypothetical protein BWY07_02390 [Candidatus Hydrogenedentes bacterium ADurb.Bin170]
MIGSPGGGNIDTAEFMLNRYGQGTEVMAVQYQCLTGAFQKCPGPGGFNGAQHIHGLGIVCHKKEVAVAEHGMEGAGNS